MTADLENVVGDCMSSNRSKEGIHSSGKGIKRKLHEVAQAHQALYDELLRSFDPVFHRKVTGQHNRAYGKVIGDLTDQEFDNEDDAVKAVADALVLYRRHAGIPTIGDKDEKDLIYREVRELFSHAKKGGFGETLKGVESLYKSGNLYQLFNQIHQRETSKTITARVENSLYDLIPEDEEPELYQGLLKAHGNYIGHEFSPGDLAAAGNRESLIEQMKELYKSDVERQILKYVNKRHRQDNLPGHEAANNNEHFKRENKKPQHQKAA